MTTLNALFTKSIKSDHTTKARRPKVSLLVPVRDEAENLRLLLPALKESDYPHLELIVLDDNSNDGSLALASSILSESAFEVRLVSGKSWSKDTGLSGKSHACAQLAEAATGDILIFCDADVRPSKCAITRTVDTLMMTENKTAGITALPRQSCNNLLVRLLIPWVMHLPPILTLPLFCSWRLPISSMQMANGQWLAIHRSDYFRSGGHRSLGLTPIEDVALARRLHQVTGRGVRPVLAIQDIRVEMYSSWQQSLEGFSKNLVALLGGSAPVFLCIVMLVNCVFLFPVWGYFFRSDLALSAAVLCIGVRVLTLGLFGMPRRDVLLHPFSLLLFNIAAYKSLASRLRGLYEWKGRVVQW